MKNPRSISGIEQFTELLDTKFKIPGTNIRFGLDPILGLIPGFGDMLSYEISSVLIFTMIRHGASGKVVIKIDIQSGTGYSDRCHSDTGNNFRCLL